MLTRLYDWSVRYSQTRYAPAVMGVVSFLDSSMLPIPPHPLLCILLVAKPERAYYWATICTVSSVIGAYLGYTIGFFFFPIIGQWLIDILGYHTQFDEFRANFIQWASDWTFFWIIVGKGLTPIPFKIVTIAAGLAEYPILLFSVACVISRGMQFYALAWLFRHQGGRIDTLARRYGNVIGWSAIGLIILIVVASKYL
jgi:membrane protein YqaA with SNARE-associated domain